MTLYKENHNKLSNSESNPHIHNLGTILHVHVFYFMNKSREGMRQSKNLEEF